MSADQKFEFDREEDGSLPLATAVFQALGAASMCWEDVMLAGIFDSTRAKEIGDALLERIDEEDGRPLLGYATTQQLLDELTARIRVDYYAGGGGLQYSTVKGRPESSLNNSPTVQPEDMVE